ncbi:hypothetical protein F8O01_00065 [Pseudoclavibacter chungangensis]|uniref:Uncharacterized protein n=1 Tax=Pseudoclavibacter chungangensis TaxID=587635 RepID=A0A7J5C174_9MICO|nr:hypothetical protein [Pseudoclavibacter chungangensis]KAB1662386.1 hypothetical protein F8O01_00065 [Pseudoclavibacter chungangensis]NYJ68407.1 hypothetical protein [Pseudoclavibacter chungangensis]
MTTTARHVLERIARGPTVGPDERRVLSGVFDRCAVLRTDLERAVASGALRRIVLDGARTPSVDPFDAVGGALILPRGPVDSVDEPEIAFLLGHGLHRAVIVAGTIAMRDEIGALAHGIARARPQIGRHGPHRDYSGVVDGLVVVHEFDEARAQIAGWNASVEFHRSVLGELAPEDLAHGPRADDVLRGSRLAARPRPPFTLERDLTLAPTPRNLDAMLRVRVRRPPERAALGPEGTSDHANLAGAVAVGFVCRVNRSHHPRSGTASEVAVALDLSTHALDPALLLANGIDLGTDRAPVPYLDVGPEPRRRGRFHHTIGRNDPVGFTRRAARSSTSIESDPRIIGGDARRGGTRGSSGRRNGHDGLAR